MQVVGSIADIALGLNPGFIEIEMVERRMRVETSFAREMKDRMKKGPKFTAKNVFVFSDPYLKIMDGESDRCVGYMPKKATNDLIESISGKNTAHPDWVTSWFDEKAKRHLVSLSWNKPELRERFVSAFDALGELERFGIVYDDACELCESSVADDLNDRYAKEEDERSKFRKKWFANEVNAMYARRVAIVRGTCVSDSKTGKKSIDQDELEFIKNVEKFMSDSERPDYISLLGDDCDGGFMIGYIFTSGENACEFKRRLNCNVNKPEGVEIVDDGPVYEEMILFLEDKNFLGRRVKDAPCSNMICSEKKDEE